MPGPFQGFAARMLSGSVVNELMKLLPEPAREALAEVRDYFAEHGRFPKMELMRKAPIGAEGVQAVNILLGTIGAGELARMINVFRGQLEGGTVRGCNVAIADVHSGHINGANVVIGEIHGGLVERVVAVIGDVHGGEVRSASVVVGDVHGGTVACHSFVGVAHGGTVTCRHMFGEARGGRVTASHTH
jgi:hypothetical protein